MYIYIYIYILSYLYICVYIYIFFLVYTSCDAHESESHQYHFSARSPRQSRHIPLPVATDLPEGQWCISLSSWFIYVYIYMHTYNYIIYTYVHNMIYIYYIYIYTFMTTVYMYTLYKLVYQKCPKPPMSHVHGELCGCFMLFQHPKSFAPSGGPPSARNPNSWPCLCRRRQGRCPPSSSRNTGPST